jgi:hypothetical protein
MRELFWFIGGGSVGTIRVLGAREAEVKTKQLSESDMPAVAMEDTLSRDRRR